MKEREAELKKEMSMFVEMCSLNTNIEVVDANTIASLIELDQMQETTDAGMIYFYRNDCSECKKSTPAIMEIVKKYNQEIYYYNTSVDRDNNYDEMIKVLESYNVTEVPAFVIYKDGKVIKSFGADNIILNVQDYLSNLK